MLAKDKSAHRTIIELKKLLEEGQRLGKESPELKDLHREVTRTKWVQVAQNLLSEGLDYNDGIDLLNFSQLAGIPRDHVIYVDIFRRKAKADEWRVKGVALIKQRAVDEAELKTMVDFMQSECLIVTREFLVLKAKLESIQAWRAKAQSVLSLPLSVESKTRGSEGLLEENGKPAKPEVSLEILKFLVSSADALPTIPPELPILRIATKKAVDWTYAAMKYLRRGTAKSLKDTAEEARKLCLHVATKVDTTVYTNCVCQDGKTYAADMVICIKCHDFFHCNCLRLVRKYLIDETFLCPVCDPEKSVARSVKRPTVERLVQIIKASQDLVYIPDSIPLIESIITLVDKFKEQLKEFLVEPAPTETQIRNFIKRCEHCPVDVGLDLINLLRSKLGQRPQTSSSSVQDHSASFESINSGRGSRSSITSEDKASSLMHIERRRAQESRERELQDEWEANRKLDETCQTEDPLWVSEEQNHRSRIIEDRAEKIRFEKDQTQIDKKNKAAAKEKLKVEKQEAKNRKLKRIEEKERHYRGYIGKEQLGQESQRAKARETQLQPKNPTEIDNNEQRKKRRRLELEQRETIMQTIPLQISTNGHDSTPFVDISSRLDTSPIITAHFDQALAALASSAELIYTSPITMNGSVQQSIDAYLLSASRAVFADQSNVGEAGAGVIPLIPTEIHGAILDRRRSQEDRSLEFDQVVYKSICALYNPDAKSGPFVHQLYPLVKAHFPNLNFIIGPLVDTSLKAAIDKGILNFHKGRGYTFAEGFVMG